MYVHIPKTLITKLEPCAKRCVFVGYLDFQKGYRRCDRQAQKLHVTLDASFQELKPNYSKGASTFSLQGENAGEGNMLQGIKENVEECLELDSINILESDEVMDRVNF